MGTDTDGSEPAFEDALDKLFTRGLKASLREDQSPSSGDYRSALRKPIKPASEEEPGGAGERVAGRYRLAEEIGRGGMGIVYRGYDEDLQRPVAVKILRERCRIRPGLVERFLEEARTVARLQHPGIVPLYDFGVKTDGRPFLVMKLIGGRTFEDLLRARKSPTDGRAGLLAAFREVCRAVGYAHAAGVVHRDLKPSNVLLGDHGEVQVTDWGLALALEDALSRQGEIVGTAGYMAPEQARGDSTDARADVFALGAILTELLTGEPPIVAQSSNEARDLAAREELEPALARLRACSADPELVRIAEACLSPRVEQRMHDGHAVAEQITRHLEATERRAENARILAATAEAVSHEADARASAERRARRMTQSFSIVGLVVVILGVGVLAWFEQDRRSRQDQTASLVYAAFSQARMAFDEARRGPVDDDDAWHRAEAAATHVDEFLQQRDTPQKLREEVNRFLSQAHDEFQRAEVDRALLARLEEIDDRHDLPPARVCEAYAETFAEYGIPIDLPASDPIPPRLLRNGLGPKLADALDSFAHHRLKNKEPKETWRSPIKLAMRLDADPLRTKIRDAYQEYDPQRLGTIAREVNVRKASARSLHVLATSLVRAGRSAEAIRLLEQARLVHPESYDIHHDLALALIQKEDPRRDLIRELQTTSVAVAPQSSHAWLDLGTTYLVRFADIERGEACLMRAMELNERNVTAMSQLGIMHWQEGRIRTGISWLRKLFQLEPGHSSTPHLARMLTEVARTEEALSVIEQHLVVRPENARGWLTSGLCLLDLGRLADAAVSFDTADSLRKETDTELPDSIAQGRAVLASLERAAADLDDDVARLASSRNPWRLAQVARVKERHFLTATLAEPLVESDAAKAWPPSILAAAASAAIVGNGDALDAPTLSDADRRRWRDLSHRWFALGMEGTEAFVEGNRLSPERAAMLLEAWMAKDELRRFFVDVQSLSEEEARQWHELNKAAREQIDDWIE